jgi:phosphoribosylanthranilate isomerase
MRRLRVQIAGISSLADALAAVEAGADSLGFTLRLPDGPHNGLDETKARAIIRQLPAFVCPVLVTYLDRADEAFELCAFLGVRAVQFHGPMSVDEVRRLRERSSCIKIIKSIIVGGPEVVAEAQMWAPEVDAILTDTYDPGTGKTGATGKMHDWSISRRIVEAVSVPVILAGGLRPENVAEAVRAVRPWGVDVHTGVERPDGSFDPDRARAFVDAARLALEEGR